MSLSLLTLNTKIRTVFRLTPTVYTYFLFEQIILNVKENKYLFISLMLLLIVLRVKYFKIVLIDFKF